MRKLRKSPSVETGIFSIAPSEDDKLFLIFMYKRLSAFTLR